MRPALTLALLIAAAAAPAFAQTTSAAPAEAKPSVAYPVKIPAPGGEVIIPSAQHHQAYNEFHYAPARRVGDVLYVSGVVASPLGDEATDAAAFEQQVRRAFKHLDQVLKASGVGFDDVVMINSFHVWDGPNALVTRIEQIETVNRVKAEFVKGPQPAWTAVGTTGLVAPRGVIEFQLIAQVPAKG